MKAFARMRGIISAAVLAALISACAHDARTEKTSPETSVAYRLSSDNTSTLRYEVREDEAANAPVAIDNSPPIYPRAAIELHLPLVLVGVKVIVDKDGKVGEVRIASAGNDASQALFDDAVREAVSRWKYVPLTFTRWEDVVDAQGNVVDSRPASVEHRPFSLDYEFRFELRDGKPVVDARTHAGR